MAAIVDPGLAAWMVEQDEVDALLGEPVEPWDLDLALGLDLDVGSSVGVGSDGFPTPTVPTSTVPTSTVPTPTPISTPTPGELLAGIAVGVPDLGRLEGFDAGGLSDAAQIDLLVGLERLIARASAVQVRVLAVMEAEDPSVDGFAQEAVACALRLSGRSAQNRLKSARSLVDDLPETLELMTGGVLSPAHAQAVVHACWLLPRAEQRRELERRVLGRAGELTVPELGRVLRRAVLVLDPATGETRHHRAREERRVQQFPLPDGMAELRHVAPAQDILDVYQRLDAARRLLPAGDGRTADQQRSDLLTDAVRAGLPLHGLPCGQGQRPGVHVIIDLFTLLGLNDQPADLAGYGAVTADVARAMAADPTGTWHRLVTDPLTGGLLDYGRVTYRPPVNLRDFIVMRDGVCAHPGCVYPAHRCDLEHCRPHGEGPGQGGATSPANTAACCRRHHRCKTFTAWDYSINPDGSFTWTSPTGHRYTSRPPQRWAPGNEEEPEPEMGTTAPPEARDPEARDPEGLDPGGLDPEGLDPGGLDPGGLDPEGRQPGGLDPGGLDQEGLGSDPDEPPF